MVPLALMVAATSPRLTTAVRNDNREPSRACHHHAAAANARNAMEVAINSFFGKRFIKFSTETSPQGAGAVANRKDLSGLFSPNQRFYRS